MTISMNGQLSEHITELNTRCDIINREICAIGAKTQVGKEEVKAKLKLFETCLMPALLYGMEAWENNWDRSIWPSEQRIDYSSLMLYIPQYHK